MKKNGCHSGAIKKNNMKDKNKDKDKWISALRSPYESTFSKLKNKAKYKGTAKVQFQNFSEHLAVYLLSVNYARRVHGINRI